MSSFIKSKKIKIYSVFMSALILISALPTYYALSEDTVERHIASSQSAELLELFGREYPKGKKDAPGVQRGNAIRVYLLDCCRSDKDIVRILEDGGFNIKITNDIDKVKEFNQYYRQSKAYWKEEYSEYVIEEYDTFISGTKRSTKWENLLLVGVEYSVNAFIKEGRVLWVTSRINY